MQAARSRSESISLVDVHFPAAGIQFWMSVIGVGGPRRAPVVSATASRVIIRLVASARWRYPLRHIEGQFGDLHFTTRTPDSELYAPVSVTIATMKYFFCKLTPPRPTFAIDMTDAERLLMHQHVAYWSELAAQGSAIAFGPVADPQGVYGVAVVEAPDEAAVREMSTHDPLMKAGAGFSYAIHPMPQIVLRQQSQSR